MVQRQAANDREHEERLRQDEEARRKVSREKAAAEQDRLKKLDEKRGHCRPPILGYRRRKAIPQPVTASRQRRRRNRSRLRPPTATII
jgi:hypothetical protein